MIVTHILVIHTIEEAIQHADHHRAYCGSNCQQEPKYKCIVFRHPPIYGYAQNNEAPNDYRTNPLIYIIAM